MLAILFLVLAVLLIYSLAIKPYTYWSDKDVKTGRVIPIFGENFYFFFGMESISEMALRVYNKMPSARYLGIYQFQTPILVLRSPELIKQIAVKDFDSFMNHRKVFQDDVDELLAGNLFFLKGKRWKDMRSTISPSFTSSKIKAMFVLISQNANIFAKYFLEKKEDVVEIELKDSYTRYNMDVIASAAFGLQVDSLNDKENEFYMMGREASNFNTSWKKFVFILYQMVPSLAAFFGLSIFEKRIRSFFLDLVKNTIKMREEQNINRPDMLGLLMKARKGQHVEEKPIEEIQGDSFAAVTEHLEFSKTKRDLTDVDITCQVFGFFLGGFDTVSTAMSFVAYELAVNPDVQKKLIEEIDANQKKNELPSYEDFMNMTYLDMVISETLRRRPPLMFTDRVVTKPITIEPELPDEKPLHLEVNANIVLPIYAIQHDPKYFPNPEKFDPERFSPENRGNIDPYTYMPFGLGPRNCMGSRFALIEIKALFFHLLSHFEIVPTEKTQIPFKYDRRNFSSMPEKGLYVGLKKRKV